jgi:hypothetical protein
MKKEFKIERNIDKRVQYLNILKMSVYGIFKIAKKHRITFDNILKAINAEIRSSPYWYKIGNEGRANINGHIEANFQIMYDELDWCCWYDGKFMGLTKDFKYSKDFNQELMRTGHIYKGTEVEYNPEK